MVDATGIAGQLGNLAGTFTSIGIKIIAGILGIALIGFAIWLYRRRKKYNIPVTIWIPRSDGKITDEVQAKGGYFKTKQEDGGKITTFRLKRKGTTTVDIPPPDSRFLVGLSRRLYLIQKGVDDFEPVHPDSFRYVETEDGEKLAVTNLKCINQDATAWVEDNRENAKKRFTLHSFWDQYKDWIQITVFIFIVMISIYVNWIGLKDVVDGLKEVAQALSQAKGGVSVS